MTPEIPVLLLVGSDPPPRRAVAIALTRSFTVLTAPTLVEATSTMRALRLDVVVADFELVDGSGVEVLARAQRYAPAAVRILIAPAQYFVSARDLCGAALLEPLDLATFGARLARLVRKLGTRATT